MLSYLININEESVTELIVYLKFKHKVDIDRFITLNDIEQLGYILVFLEYKNIGMLVDNNQAILYYIDARLAANHVLKVYNESGEISDRFDYIQFEETSIINAYINTIKYIFKEVLIPF